MPSTSAFSFPGPVWFASTPVAVVEASGPDAVDLLNRLGTQDVKGVGHQETRFGLFVTHQGKLIAQTRFVAQGDVMWLVTDALMGKPLVEWLEKYTITEDANFRVLEESWPLWRFVAREAPSPAMADMRAALTALSPVALTLPRGWGHGIDLLVEGPSRAQALLALDERQICEVAAEEYERARLEVGEPAMGHEVAPLSQPLEWRLGSDGISWTKGCFVGQEVLGRLDNFNKVARLCVGVRASTGRARIETPEQRATARLIVDGATVGKISSMIGTEHDGWVGLAVVKRDAAHAQPASLRFGPDDEVPIELEDRPFWSGTTS